MMEQYVKVRCAQYEVDGKMFAIPHACLGCKEKGLVLSYNPTDRQMEAVCSMREDAKGRFILGCNKVSFILPMTEAQFQAIIHDPHTANIFFYLETLK
jgi:hypothetical protein